VHTLIIGAGLAGLSCAYHLKNNFVLVERETTVGGVARTFLRNGFLFDCTGHWLHLRDPVIAPFIHRLLDGKLECNQRRAAIYSHGVLTPYPFQAHTYGLPTAVVAECVLGFFQAREAAIKNKLAAPQSFEDFVRRNMGDGIAKHFMLPYNQKIWTTPPSEMSYDWCSRFVPLPTPEEVVWGALEPAGTGEALGYNATFLYPKEGGIQQLPNAVHAALRQQARLQTEVVLIDWQKKIAHLQNGSTLDYTNLVSTMPLNALVKCLFQPPESVVTAGTQLRCTSVTYWDLGFSTPNRAQEPHWIYFPDLVIPFYRVGSSSAAAPSVAPPQSRSYYVEVSHPQGTACPVSSETILQHLRQLKIVGAYEEPVVCHSTTIDCGYVIMNQAYGEARKHILEWLELQQIHSVGRYGAWTYDSMEGAMAQGYKTALRLK
jgi:protoporphyrinogen oxidase